MQKRFCICGHMVMVRYIYCNGGWQPQVIPGDKVEQKTGNNVCPACGNPLSIHTLR